MTASLVRLRTLAVKRSHHFSTLTKSAVAQRHVGAVRQMTKAAPPQPRITPESEFPEPIEITPEIRRNNAILGIALLGMVCGIAYYSMHAVGQAGTLEGEDPMEKLRKDAELAQQKKKKEEQQMEEEKEMIRQVESGAFDPDNYEEEEAEYERQRKNKRPWWKFW